MTDTTQRLRGRRGQGRRTQNGRGVEWRRRSSARRRRRGSTSLASLPDLSPLTALLATSGEVTALADRLRRSGGPGRPGPAPRRVRGDAARRKSFLAAAFVLASGERLVWVARDAEIADRVAEELTAWLGDPAAVVTLEPRTALAYERSELDSRRERRPRRGPGRLAQRHAADSRRQRPRAVPAHARPGGPARAAAGARTAPADAPGTGPARARRAGLRGTARGWRARRVRPPRRHRRRVPGRPAAARAHRVVRRRDRVAARVRSGQPARRPSGRRRSRLLPASEFLWPRAPGDACASAWARPSIGCRQTYRPTWPAWRTGELVDAAEIWAGHLATATGLDHIGTTMVLLDEPGDVTRPPTSCGHSPTSGGGAREAGAVPKGWPAAYIEPRDGSAH